MKWKWTIGATLMIGAAALVYFNGWTRTRAIEIWGKIAPRKDENNSDSHAENSRGGTPAAAPFDGHITIDDVQRKAIGLSFATVRAQTDSFKLMVNGTTAYDPNSETQIRPKFASVIEKVYYQIGQSVKKDDKLVDLYSAELAKAKSEFEIKTALWQHDKKVLERSEGLIKKGAISQKDYDDDVKDEATSRFEAKVAQSALEVYGLTNEEIEDIKNQDGPQKARMTIRSPAEGVVIHRDAVVGNRYDDKDVLMLIAPLDHFWVWGNVYPGDASRVNIGQDWLIHCSFLGQNLRRKVESISSEIDSETKTVRIGTRIENINGRMKAKMLVTGYVEIPPLPDRTVIPRLAMISTDGANFVFVRKPGDTASQTADRFERRKIRVAQEYQDEVIVAEGLKPGEEVATKGSLNLSQLFEDQIAVETGSPL